MKTKKENDIKKENNNNHALNVDRPHFLSHQSTELYAIIIIIVIMIIFISLS